MDRGAALQELGLTTCPSANELRRAYLRCVRAHPPERDPEGFARVRAAYECLTRWAADVPVATVVLGNESAATGPEPLERASAQPEMPQQSSDCDQVESQLTHAHDSPPTIEELLAKGARQLEAPLVDWSRVNHFTRELDNAIARSQRTATLTDYALRGNSLAQYLLLADESPSVSEELVAVTLSSRCPIVLTFATRYIWERGDSVTAQWQLARELVELDNVLKPELKRAIADAILSRTDEPIWGAFEDADLRIRDAKWAVLTRRAPMIARMLVSTVPASRLRKTSRAQRGGFSVGTAIAVVFVLRMVLSALSGQSGSRETTSNAAVQRQEPTIAEAVATDPKHGFTPKDPAHLTQAALHRSGPHRPCLQARHGYGSEVSPGREGVHEH